MSSNIWFGDYTVHIQPNVQKSTNNVYLIKHEENSKIFMRGNGTALQVRDGDTFADEELVFAEMSNDQLKAFAESLSKFGIKTDSDSVALGKLAATEKHLEDMRHIALYKYPKEKE